MITYTHDGCEFNGVTRGFKHEYLATPRSKHDFAKNIFLSTPLTHDSGLPLRTPSLHLSVFVLSGVTSPSLWMSKLGPSP